MKKVIFVWFLLFADIAVVFVPLYQLKDSHIGFSNICPETLYPDTCK